MISINTEQKQRLTIILIWLALFIVACVLYFYRIGYESLWYDESYTASIVKHSIGDIWRIAGTDSHPPLYFMALKIVTLLFGNTEAVLRSFSALGALALASLGLGPVRKIFGTKAGLFFTFLVATNPIMVSMAHEARMYTWAAFTVALCALKGYEAVLSNKKRDWFWFGLAGLASAYLHYYALLSVFIIGFIMFAWLLTRNRKKLPYFIATGAMVLLYLPWLLRLSTQVTKVAHSFWIPQVTGGSILGVLIYPFSHKFSEMFTLPFIALLLSLVIVYIGLKKAAQYENRFRPEAWMLKLAVAAYFLTMVAGITASELIRPILIGRYMMPVLGLFLLAIAVGLASLSDLKKSLGAAVLLTLLGLVPLGDFFFYKHNGPMADAVSYYKDHVEPDAVFLHTSEHTFGLFSYYFPDQKQFFYLDSVYTGYAGYSGYGAFEPNGAVISNIPALFSDHKSVYLVSRPFDEGGPLANNWVASGRLKGEGDARYFAQPFSFLFFSVRKVSLGRSLETSEIWALNAPATVYETNRLVNLAVSLKGFKDSKGQAAVTLYDGPVSPYTFYRTIYAPISNGKAFVSVGYLPAGDYSILAFQDKNGNEKPDGFFPGIYSEPTGMSTSNPVKNRLIYNLDRTTISFREQSNHIDIQVREGRINFFQH